MSSASMLDAALRYADDGHRIVACYPRSKEPIGTAWQLLATADPERIEARWRQTPQANVGIATGRGLLVSDVDVKKGARGRETLAALENRLGALPPTRTARTPSGGDHLYFTVSRPVPNRSRPGEGIDWQSDGKQVLAPPSVTPAGEYTWIDNGPIAPLPEAWIGWLIAEQSPNGKSSTLDLESGELVTAPGRNTYLVAYAGRWRRRGCTVAEVRALVLAENERVCRPPLSVREVDDTIMQSVRRWEQGEALPHCVIVAMLGEFARTAHARNALDRAALRSLVTLAKACGSSGAGLRDAVAAALAADAA